MVAFRTYRSLALIADDENGMRNACGKVGGLKSCLFTVTPGCWVTSTSVSSSVAWGVIADGGFSTVTVPVTAVAAEAGAPAEEGDDAAADDEPPDWLDAPQPASSMGATSNDATASFRMGGIPRSEPTRALKGRVATWDRTLIREIGRASCSERLQTSGVMRPVKTNRASSTP